MSASARRILFVITSSDTGGAESALRELVLRLDTTRFHPMVCSLLRAGRTADLLAARGVPVTSLEMSERPRIHQLVGASLRLAKMLDRLAIDLVQSYLYRANAMTSICARMSSRKPILVTSQRSLAPLGGRLAVWSARWTRRLSTRVVAVSQSVRHDLVTHESFPADKIVVIPNGVDTDRFRRRPQSSVRTHLGIDPEAVVVGAAGRLTPVKGFDCLLRAVARLRERGLGVQLLIAGEGPERARLEALRDALDLGESAHFLGLCEDMERLYSSLDIFVLSSLREGSPNVLLEAMACGCAVVATTVGGVPEIIEDGVSGLLVSPADERELAAALRRLSRDAGTRAALAAAAHHRVDTGFSLRHTVRAYEQLYGALLEERRRSVSGERRPH